MLIGSPISKRLVPILGYRKTLMIGGFLMMVGTSLSYFATSIWVLYITYGGKNIFFKHLKKIKHFFKQLKKIKTIF